MTNKSSFLLPQVHRHDFQLHVDHIGLHQLVQRQLLAHLRWSRDRCHHLVWCVVSCYIFYIFLVCISCGIFMVQCCTLLNIFGASYLLYIFGALYLVLGLFFDANITFFGIVCFVKCALCCILLLVHIFWCGQDLIWHVGFLVAFTYLERFEPWEAISQTSRQRSREKWGLLFSKAENTPTLIASMFSEAFTSWRNLRMDSTARSRWHIAWWGGKVTM